MFVIFLSWTFLFIFATLGVGGILLALSGQLTLRKMAKEDKKSESLKILESHINDIDIESLIGEKIRGFVIKGEKKITMNSIVGEFDERS